MALYAREHMNAKLFHDAEAPDDLEIVWVQCRPTRLPRQISQLFFCALYHPPASLNADLLLEHLTQTVDLIQTRHPDAAVIILGDMNNLDVESLCNGGILTQVVDQPTRDQAILDKIITNVGNFYAKPLISAPIGLSDHSSVLWTPNNHEKASNATHTKVVRPLRASDLRDFGSWISNHSWTGVLQADGATNKCENFYYTLQSAINTFFPCKTVTLHIVNKP